MEDFQREVMQRKFKELSPKERQKLLKTLSPEELLALVPPEARLAGLSPEEIQRLNKLTAGGPNPQKRRRKK